jgi:hypothetical protein
MLSAVPVLMLDVLASLPFLMFHVVMVIFVVVVMVLRIG